MLLLLFFNYNFPLQQEQQGHQKRVALETYVEVVKDIIEVVDWVYGLVDTLLQKRQQPLQQENYDEEIADIENKLKLIDGKTDSLAKDVNSFKQLLGEGQEKFEATYLYSKGVSRLRFFLSYLCDFLSAENGTGLQPANLANDWADSVLDLGVAGVAQVSVQPIVQVETRIFLC